MNIDQFQMISSGEEYFPDFCEMCQVRFWKVTRTVNQIKKSMYTEVDYTDKNLLLYLPMNEGRLRAIPNGRSGGLLGNQQFPVSADREQRHSVRGAAGGS